MYEVCYTNCQGERRVKRKVATWDQAKEIAKELAIATGYRTIIRRDREELWDLLGLKLDTLEYMLVAEDVHPQRAANFQRAFDWRKANAIAVVCPSECSKSLV